MTDFVLFWMAKYTVQLALPLIVVTCIVVLINIPTAVQRVFCKHDRYNENRQCDAICRACGRNLGFIDDLRQRDRLRAQQREQDNG